MYSILRTKRLVLLPSNIVKPEQVLAYLLPEQFTENRFDPNRSPDYYTTSCQQAMLMKDRFHAAEQTGFRFWLATKEAPQEIIGTVALNNVVYGAFHSCFIGYKLALSARGQGYMTEAVAEICRFAFETCKLHRIEANIIPSNEKSMGVVTKLGFVNEGLSTKYLEINGVWEDHYHMALLNE